MRSDCVFLLAGQCGNQLGYAIIDSLFDHLKDQIELQNFFRKNSENAYYSRAVCLDTEPKVIDECVARAKRCRKWMYDPNSVSYKHGGAGNNWALGYSMAEGDFLTLSINLVRREFEFCIYGCTLIIIHSIAGGTGSGLGTRLTETIAEEFPDATLINIAIAPYHFGEVVVQHYNTVLSLSKILNASHGVILFENEVAQQLCIEMKGIERPLLTDINATIASNVLPIFLSKIKCCDGNVSSNKFEYGLNSLLINDVIELCSHPSYRFIFL
jgi:tubulin delta